MLNLNDYYKNIYTQRGEDGILEYIFEKIGVSEGNFVEFGAWDGMYLCNSRLLAEKGWGGLFIESDKEKSKELKNNYKDNKKIICLNSLVEEYGENSFDNILKKHFDVDIDFVSIDVDGLDYYLFRSIDYYRPKVFCIEGGKYIPPMQSQEVPRELASEYVGQSLASFNHMAQLKGYTIICFTQNIIIIRDDYKDLFPVSTDLLELYRNGLNKHAPKDFDHMKRILKKYGVKNEIIENFDTSSLNDNE